MAGRALEILPGTGRGTARRRRVVEGLAVRQNVSNRPFHVVKDFTRGNAKRSIPLRHQPFVPSFIAPRICAPIMRFPVHLDRQPRFETDEVEHERPRRMLPPPFKAARPLSQLAPQQHFRQGHLSAEFPRNADACPGSSQHRASPSIVLRTVPLPVPGRILVGANE